MKILVVSRGYPSERYPMNGIFEMDQAKALVKCGNEVVFASIDIRSIRRKRKWGFEKFVQEGVLVYALNLPIGRVSETLKNLFLRFALKKVFQRVEKDQGIPDIIHAHFPNIAKAATWLKIDKKIPLVVTEHSSDMMKQPIPDVLKRNAEVAYSVADKVIAVSPVLKNIIKDEFNVSSLYIPNIVDTKNFLYKERPKSNIFTFLAVGNLLYRKRMDLIVEAFREAFGDNKDVKLIIVGEGAERKKIEELIKKFSLQDRVTLTGRLHRSRIAEYMKRSSCFVLPSRAETFGVVYIEAMASGIPVIGTKCGGPEGFINKKNGMLVEVDNLKQLALAMKDIYENIDLYNKRQIALDTISKFSPEAVAKNLTEIYKNILE